jgi:hypothetical protein
MNPLVNRVILTIMVVAVFLINLNVKIDSRGLRYFVSGLCGVLASGIWIWGT